MKDVAKEGRLKRHAQPMRTQSNVWKKRKHILVASKERNKWKQYSSEKIWNYWGEIQNDQRIWIVFTVK